MTLQMYDVEADKRPERLSIVLDGRTQRLRIAQQRVYVVALGPDVDVDPVLPTREIVGVPFFPRHELATPSTATSVDVDELWRSSISGLYSGE